MSITLRAFSIPDAAGIAEIDGQLRLLRPPYAMHSSPQLADTDLDEATARAGYVLTEKQFANIRDLIFFLRQTHKNWMEKVGLPLGGTLSAEEFIAGISSEVIRDVIDRIDNELVPAGLNDQAFALLLAIIKSAQAEGDPKLRTRALASLVNIHTQRNSDGKSLSSEVTDRRFRTLQDDETKSKIRNIKIKIRDRHCVLEVQADA
jgi:hypothetical protein